MTPRDILTAPPAAPDEPSYLDPEATPEILTIENSASIMEHQLVQTLLDLMHNGSERARLKAADQTAEMIGKKQKNIQVLAQNAQINQQNNQFLEHLQKQTQQIGGPDAPDRDLPAPKSEDIVDP